MKKKRISKINSFAVIILIISFLVGFCGVGTLFVDKNDYQQTEEASTLADNPANVIPEKETVIDSGNYTVKTWDEKLEEIFDNGQDFDFEGSGSEADPYQISTAEQLALAAYLANNNGVYPRPTLPLDKIPAYNESLERPEGLPEIYLPLEYLESDGWQFIDTGFIPTASTKVCVECMMTEGSTQATYASIFGSQNQDDGTSSLSLTAYKGGEQYISGRVGYNSTLRTGVLYDYDVKYKIEASFNKITIDGVEYIGEAEVWEPFNYSMYIFTRNTPTISTRTACMSSFKLYSFKIYDGDVLVRDFVPCYNVETTNVGLYDLINDSFYMDASGEGFYKEKKQYLTVKNKMFELTNDIYLNDGKLELNEATDESGKTTYSVAYEDGGDGILYRWSTIWDQIHFEGNNYCVYGMYIDSTSTSDAGFIAGNNSYIYLKDFNIANSVVNTPSSGHAGGIVAYCARSSIIKNCSFDGDVRGANYSGGISGAAVGTIESCVNYGKVYGGSHVAGIAGSFGGAIKNCINYGKIFGSSIYAGGIVGMANAYITNFYNCINYGEVNGAERVGGIVGYDFYIDSTIKNCVNYGDVKASSIAGGIVGMVFYTGTIIISDCTNHGKVSITSTYGGGIAGRKYSNTSVSNCDNYGDIESGSYVGGITGGEDGLYVKNCINKGNVKGVNSVGGVTAVGNPENCINYGNVNGTSTNVGGISSGGSVKNCINYGNTSGRLRVGGIVGNNNGKTSNCLNYGNVTASYYYVGGISGYGGNILSCTNYGNIKNTSYYAGGIVGLGNDISLCENHGNINGTSYVGGLVGNGGTVKNCTNLGYVYGTLYVGGVSGFGNSYFECINHGTVKSPASSIGGIVGYSNGGKTVNCVNLGDIYSVSKDVGGIIGLINKNIKTEIINCINRGNLSGATVGAAVGYIYSSSSCIADGFINAGKITSNSDEFSYVASGDSYLKITNCLNTGAIVSGNSSKTHKEFNIEDFDRFCYNYRTGEIGFKSVSATGSFSGELSTEYLLSKNYTDLTSKPDDFNSKYTQLEYIESTGTQYIDSGVKSQNNIGCEVEFSFTNNDTDYQYLLGELTAGSSRFCPVFLDRVNNPNNISYCPTLTFQANTYGTFDTKVHNVNFNVDGTRKIIYDKQTIGSVGDTGVGEGGNIFIFARNYNGLSLPACAKIYSLNLYDNGKPIRSFIPVKRNADGVVGLYDRVEGKFYTNQGTGNFVAGPKASNMPAGYEELEYIESTGTQYIDTGFIPTINTKVEMDIYHEKSTSNHAIFCARSDLKMNTFSLFKLNTTTRFDYDVTQNTMNTDIAGARRTIIVDKNKVSIDGVDVLQLSSRSFTVGGRMWIGASYTGNYTNVGNYALMKIYSFKISDDGNTVRSFIPAKRISDGVVGLYETEEGKFYTNQGSGNFVAGAAK